MFLSLTGKLDFHKESNVAKFAADNSASPLVEAAKKGILFCTYHPGMWISKPGMMMGVTTRDCPLCLQQEKQRSSSIGSYHDDNTTANYHSHHHHPHPHLHHSQYPPPPPSAVAAAAGGSYSSRSGSSFSGSIHHHAVIGRKHFSSGTYTGQLVNGRMCGRGVFAYASGDCYDGEWVDDLMSGRGRWRVVGWQEVWTGSLLRSVVDNAIFFLASMLFY